MNLDKKIDGFIQLGAFLYQFGPNGIKNPTLNKLNDLFYEHFQELIKKQYQYNGWFTEYSVKEAIYSISLMLEKESINKWIDQYRTEINKKTDAKKVAVIMAGNIPLVGFHDFLCVLISGNHFVGKLSSDDKHLLPFVAQVLIKIEPSFAELIRFQENKIGDIDAVIATGSNNSSKYFEYYFGKYPHIIRKNRSSVAVLDDKEDEADLQKLGNDIFQYFGLGCRNVSKLFVPEEYNFNFFFESIFKKKEIVNHNKYANNYNYNRTIYLMKGEKFLDNNFLLLKEDKDLASPVAVLYYERYKDQEQLENLLKMNTDAIQCIVSKNKKIKNSIAFGKAQCPALSDYADGVDTVKFLSSL